MAHGVKGQGFHYREAPTRSPSPPTLMPPHADPAAASAAPAPGPNGDPGLSGPGGNGGQRLPRQRPLGPPGAGTPLAVAGLLALTLCARLPAYRVNENRWGDAIARTELSLEWAASPHWISSFGDGALQYGPLHLYVMGAALKLGAAKERAGPITSLLAGTLTVLPLAALTRRLFGRTAAVWSCAALALWGLHVQMSTTGASEALSLLLVLSSLALFDPGDARKLAASGLVLTLACAVRYDSWMLAGLLSLLVLAHGKDRRAAFGRAVVFGLCSLPFPLVWLYGNWSELGDPLYPMHFVDAFHRAWVPQGIQTFGLARFRLINLVFWPGVALLTLGPLATGAALAGMGWAFRARPDVRWLLWAAWVPAAYFTFRSVVLLDFQPLARFTVTQVVLLLPFLKPGADLLLDRLPRRLARAAAALGAASVAGVTLWLAAYASDTAEEPAHSLLPLSPLSAIPPDVRRTVALFDAQGAGAEDLVLVDAAPHDYRDSPVSFFIRHPWQRVVRCRRPHWAQKLEEKGGRVEWIVRFEGGPLEAAPGVELRGAALRFRERWYDEVPGAPAPMHLYRARR